MPVFTDTASLNKYVSPILLQSIQLMDDNYTQLFGKVNPGARSAEGVNKNMIINDFEFETGVDVDDTFGEPESVADKKGIVPWTNYTSKVYRVSTTDMSKMTYEKESAVKKMIVESLKSKLAIDAIHAVAPTSHTAGTPVVQGTGATRAATGTKRITKADILKLAEDYVGKDFVLVLCKAHKYDLLAEELGAADNALLTNLKTGQIGSLFGINVTVNEMLPIKYVAANTKKLIGAAPAALDKWASIIVEKNNTMFDTYSLGINYVGKEADMVFKVPHSRIRVYGEFIGSQIEDDKMRGAIIDGTV